MCWASLWLTNTEAASWAGMWGAGVCLLGVNKQWGTLWAQAGHLGFPAGLCLRGGLGHCRLQSVGSPPPQHTHTGFLAFTFKNGELNEQAEMGGGARLPLR